MPGLVEPSAPGVWTQEPAEVLQRLDSRQAGLTQPEATRRLASHGPNRLVEKPPLSPWWLLLQQFRSLLIALLLGAAVLAAALGNWKDAVVIAGVVVFNALLGFQQEYQAEQTLAALKQMLPPRARVRRAGQRQEVLHDELVPGDIVLLQPGDRVPADGRLLVAHSLEIDESPLTGESQPVEKQTEPLPDADLPLAERSNLAYMNTVVTHGRGEMVVVATGMQTEVGRLAGMLASTEEGPTPLQQQLSQLGRRLAILAIALVALVSGLELARGTPLDRVFFTAVALAVAAVPEGLPAVVTVTLAVGMHRMARNRAVVKRLAAVETLGSTTVICSDKTGTLTLNQMTARALAYRGMRYQVTGEGYGAAGQILPEASAAGAADLSPVLLPLALCNDSRVHDGTPVGSPTEGALLVLAAKGGVDRAAAERRLPRLAEIPFDSAHKSMATFHQDGERVCVFVKGAPDVLLARCDRWLGPDGEQALTAAARARIVAENEVLAARALRVLAVASGSLPAAEFNPALNLFDYLHRLSFVGLVGLMDPPRPEARAAIAQCRQAGIAVKMITGDHAATASAVASELGLVGAALTGSELDRCPADELAARIEGAAVLARVTPEHKVTIVRALQERGQVVAMTGDGVNDAPALKQADIGVAMGRTGTEVSKEAASMVLTDDNFATIVAAVKQGRTIYDNIVKFVRFQLTTNLGALLSMVSAPLLGLPVPFNPIQILFVNLIMDGPPALALGLEPAQPGIMQAPPRPRQETILTWWRLGRLLGGSVVMAAGTLGILCYGLQTGSQPHALTLAFTTFVLSQLFNLLNVRAGSGTIFTSHLFRNPRLWLALATVLALQVIAITWPFAQAIFRTTPLSLADWGLAAAVAATLLLVEEVRKGLRRLFWRATR